MPSAIDYGVDSVLDVVTEIFGLEGTHRGVEYDVLCVNPKHNESKPSCSINLNTGYWNCLACGVGGDLAKLGQMVLGRPADEIVGLLSPSTPEAKLAAFQRRISRIQWQPERKRRSVPLPEYPPLESHPELRKRGFTVDTINKWELGWCASQLLKGNKGEYTIQNAIAIPIKNAAGENLAWCYRSTEASPSWQPRYLYTPKVEISELWFGLRHYHSNRPIAIVEGGLDAMWSDQCGVPALALLGSKMGERKISWLQNFTEATLLPDYDNAGAQWQKRISAKLGNRMPINIGQYRSWFIKKSPEADGTWRRARDPEELRPLDLELMYHSAVPYVEYAFRQKSTLR